MSCGRKLTAVELWIYKIPKPSVTKLLLDICGANSPTTLQLYLTGLYRVIKLLMDETFKTKGQRLIVNLAEDYLVLLSFSETYATARLQCTFAIEDTGLYRRKALSKPQIRD